jgi:hypothetical protein
MKYVIAVVQDRIQAEAAFTDLEKAGINLTELSIIGRGYKTADEFGFLDPSDQGKKGFLLMAIWLVPFGFAGGFVFDYITGLDTFAWAGTTGRHFVGGLAGAIGGAMGSFFVGGGSGIGLGSGDSLPYRNRLDEGRYLVVIKDPREERGYQIRKILEAYNPDSISEYDPN